MSTRSPAGEQPRRPYDAPVDLYEVLGAERTASPAELRRAYLGLARRYHPDTHAGSPAPVRAAAETSMRRVNEAWATLGDPERRRAYDAGLAAAPRPPDPPWQPFDDGDDDEPDWRLVADEAGTGIKPPGWLTLAPVLLLVGGGTLLVLGVFIDLVPVTVVGLALLVLSGLLFVAAPVVAVAISSQAERR